MQTMQRVSIQDVLHARDERAARQAEMLARHHAPLISFTMNIAGDIKYTGLIHRAFLEGKRRILRRLERMNAAVLDSHEVIAHTGCEALWAVDADATVLKAAMCVIEEADALGRLFDMDVLDAQGVHLSRNGERTCLICGAPVRACARSRAHSAQELFEKAQEIIRTHFEEQWIRQTGEIAQKALLYEALTTPKPGLVDCENSGAHNDMDLFSFAASASALRPYLESCVRLGIQHASCEQLQYAGMQAEEEMFAAAKANTHKGAIFSLGILCYALGCCGEGAEQTDVLTEAARVGQFFLKQLEQLQTASTGGEQQFRQYGLTGARGEASSGFRSVQTFALASLKQALQSGKTLPQAGLDALLALMAHVQDSNIIRRAGMQTQRWVMEQAQNLLQNGYTPDDLRTMNEQFVKRRISPGGSADLLAVTYFLYFLDSASSQAKAGFELAGSGV